MADWISLDWHETSDLGPDSPDYIAWHDGKRVARVYAESTIMDGQRWRWFVFWYATPNAGIADSRREAFVEVARLYNLHLKASIK
jgi:hypothetical protein